MPEPSVKAKTGLIAAIIGTALVALCCFTPLLVVGLGAMGLGVLTSYLDYVLLPALVVMLIVTIMSYHQWRRTV
jgi:mercuric ion transport protein